MTTSSSSVVGIIGGSGLYQIDGLTQTEWKSISSPFGTPSDQILHGVLNGVNVRFLPRHGRGHRLSPSGINYRANIDALKRTGVTDLISVSACGSLKEELPPGHFVLVDQFIDRTFAREKSFFTNGCVAHVSFGDPVSSRLVDCLEKALVQLNIDYTRGGTYLAMEGPQFSTKAESNLYRQWGCSVIGMTNMPEAKLAREAEMGYATVAMVTDYDCWHEGHDSVTVDQVIQVLTQNADKGRALVQTVIPLVAQAPLPCPSGCHHALEYALITPAAQRDPDLMSKLDAVARRVLTPTS